MRWSLFGIIAMAVLLAVLLGSAPFASAQTTVTGTLSGRSALAPSGTGKFYLNVSGGPASEARGNVTIRVYITGSDLTGGLPQKSSPHTASSNGTGTFNFNVTAPQKEQGITLVVEINSTAGVRTEKTTVTRAITIVTPIILTATFRNDGGSAAVNVSVRFYIDGKLAGSTNISRIDPATSATAKLTYLPVGLTPGAHTVRVEADLNRNGVIEPDKGEVVIVDLFYKKDFELTWPWAVLIMGIAVSLSYLVIRARRRRR